MLNGENPIKALEAALASALASIGLPSMSIGAPEAVENPCREAEAIFQGVAKARPSKQAARLAAVAFLEGNELDEQERDLVASALCEPIREHSGARVLGHPKFAELLVTYERDAREGDLWRLTWFCLVGSYFSFNPVKASEPEHAGWKALREMLQRSWQYIDNTNSGSVVPDWIRLLRREKELFTGNAAAKYTASFLDGDSEVVDQLASDLGIAESSWFWHALVLSAVQACCQLVDDDSFRRRITRLLELIESRQVFRDEALVLVLERYHRCHQHSVHEQLKDYVIHKDVWRNPKLREAGLATKWTRVSDSVWQMVLGWVNEANLRLFFELLASRNEADQGRLHFWSRYMNQIAWTRLIFGAKTFELARRNADIRALIVSEEGAYARLTGYRHEDAFMMQLGDYLVIEFSKQPNACYVYRTRGLKFDKYEREYTGGTDDLKYGFHTAPAARITHTPGWQVSAESELRSLGIAPDNRSDQRVPARPAVHSSVTPSAAQPPFRSESHVEYQQGAGSPRRATFSMGDLRMAVTRVQSARIDDRRENDKGGRLWVENPESHLFLESKLKAWGFRWAPSRNAWYYPEEP